MNFLMIITNWKKPTTNMYKHHTNSLIFCNKKGLHHSLNCQTYVYNHLFEILSFTNSHPKHLTKDAFFVCQYLNSQCHLNTNTLSLIFCVFHHLFE